MRCFDTFIFCYVFEQGHGSSCEQVWGFPRKASQKGNSFNNEHNEYCTNSETDCLCFASVFTGLNIRQKSHITKWKEIAHIIAMGLVRKSNMEKY